MARISSYPYDTTVQDNDAWIGTQASNQRTKQFTAEAVAEYLNLKAKVNIGGQMSFTWTDVEKGGAGTMSKVGGGGAGAAFSTLSNIYLSTTEINGQNVVAFLDYIKTKNILIGQGDQISQFGHYTLDTYTVDADPLYYQAGLTYLGGNGTIVNEKQYTIIVFDTEDGGGTGIFPNASALVWTVDHAGKWGPYPSVTVINNNDIVINVEVEYKSTTQLTITFSATFAGTAYLN